MQTNRIFSKNSKSEACSVQQQMGSKLSVEGFSCHLPLIWGCTYWLLGWSPMFLSPNFQRRHCPIWLSTHRMLHPGRASFVSSKQGGRKSIMEWGRGFSYKPLQRESVAAFVKSSPAFWSGDDFFLTSRSDKWDKRIQTCHQSSTTHAILVDGFLEAHNVNLDRGNIKWTYSRRKKSFSTERTR